MPYICQKIVAAAVDSGRCQPSLVDYIVADKQARAFAQVECAGGAAADRPTGCGEGNSGSRFFFGVSVFWSVILAGSLESET